MMQAQVQLSSLPITLVLLSNGQVAFSLHQKMATILDTSPAGQRIVISTEGILVGDVNYVYNVPYSLTEDMKGWLRSFEMVNPF